jgi:hypothetical protein
MCYITGAFLVREQRDSKQVAVGLDILRRHGGGANTLHKSRGPVADSLNDQQELESQIDLPPRFSTTKRSPRSLLFRSALPLEILSFCATRGSGRRTHVSPLEWGLLLIHQSLYNVTTQEARAMTFFHFLNCSALTFLPHFIYYKATPL